MRRSSGDFDTGAQSRGRKPRVTGRPGSRWVVVLGLAIALAALTAVQGRLELYYVKSMNEVLVVKLNVSVEHGSSCVALKGPWRHANARVGGREGESLRGCDPDASVTKRGVQDV